MLTTHTKIYVTASDGTSEMTLQEMANAIRGGLELKAVELTLDQDESKHFERKRLAIVRVNELLRHMTPDQVEQAVDMIQLALQPNLNSPTRSQFRGKAHADNTYQDLI